KEKDFFDVRGSQEAYDQLKHLYKLLGAEDRVALFVGPTAHAHSQENREAKYRWFNKATGVSDAQKEPELTIEKDETLWCTPQGQAATLKPKSVCMFTQEKSRALAKKRERLERKALTEAVSMSLR